MEINKYIKYLIFLDFFHGIKYFNIFVNCCKKNQSKMFKIKRVINFSNHLKNLNIWIQKNGAKNTLVWAKNTREGQKCPDLHFDPYLMEYASIWDEINMKLDCFDPTNMMGCFDFIYFACTEKYMDICSRTLILQKGSS